MNNILELSLYITNISYESNDWINKVIEKNDLYGLNINNFNLKTAFFLNENSDKIKIKINEKNDLVLPNICTAFYEDKLFISFCGIRNSNDFLCVLDFFLKYDDILDCYIHNGIYKSFYNLVNEIKLIIDIYHKDYKILFIGHSFGASFAKLSCLYFNKLHNFNFTCITFSSPMTGDQSFGNKFNEYVKNFINLLDPEDFVCNIPFNRTCLENNSYMINNNIIVPYKLTSRKYIFNLLRYRYPTHKLSYFYETYILSKIDLSILNLDKTKLFN